MDAASLDEKPPHQYRRGSAITTGTVEGRTISAGIALAILASLAITSFLAGQHLGRGHDANSLTDSYAAASASDDPQPASVPDQRELAERALGPSPSSGRDERLTFSAAAVERSTESDEAHPDGLRFEPLPAPTVLLSGTTDSELGNSVGVNVADVLATDLAAVIMNLRVVGPAGSTVAIHKGDRPNEAIQFVVPPTGQLLVPHLIAALDGDGRLVISADTQVNIDAIGLGTFTPVEHSDSGRFVSAPSPQIGSLVTAVDGRSLELDLQELPGINPAHVGDAVIRLNANVGSNGGTVSIVSGTASSTDDTQQRSPIVTWPAPPLPDPGLGGTALILATPDAAGQITLEYLGGSVLTADLVGYYTSEEAPVSASGLLVLEAPVRKEVRSDGASGPISLQDGAVLLVTAANGPVAGPVGIASNPLVAESHPIFNVAPNQIRTAPAWIEPTTEATGLPYLVAPPGAVVSWWRIGTIAD